MKQLENNGAPDMLLRSYRIFINVEAMDRKYVFSEEELWYKHKSGIHWEPVDDLAKKISKRAKSRFSITFYVILIKATIVLIFVGRKIYYMDLKDNTVIELDRELDASFSGMFGQEAGIGWECDTMLFCSDCMRVTPLTLLLVFSLKTCLDRFEILTLQPYELLSIKEESMPAKPYGRKKICYFRKCHL